MMIGPCSICTPRALGAPLVAGQVAYGRVVVDVATLPSGQVVALVRDSSDEWHILMDVAGTVPGMYGTRVLATRHGSLWCGRYASMARTAWGMVLQLDEVTDLTLHMWWRDRLSPVIQSQYHEGVHVGRRALVGWVLGHTW